MNTPHTFETSGSNTLSFKERALTAGVIGSMMAVPAAIIDVMNANNSEALDAVSTLGYEVSGVGIVVAASAIAVSALNTRRKQ